MESIFISDIEHEQIASQTENLIAMVDELPYPKVKEDIHALLQNIDMLHREALTRLFKEIIINHPDLHIKMQRDKSVNLLFSLYDLFHTEIQNGILAQEILSENQSPKYPLWLPVGNLSRLKENSTYKYAEEGENILICKTEGNVYAVKNCCGSTALPLDGATIDKGFLICPWHGCSYRLSDGLMVSNPLLKLYKYPVSINEENGEIKIGLNM
jgi:3-phenylpropionate/trans-cinnamate dioxygenase ferredoxin component